MKCRFEVADQSSEAELRNLLRELPVPGNIELTYRREPNYFDGCASHGPDCQVVIARLEQKIVAVALRAGRDLYVDGRPERVGYLGQLRVLPSYRRLSVLVNGFKFFRELHQQTPFGLYLTTIVEGNQRALDLLLHKPRPSFPSYRNFGGLQTLALFSGRCKARPGGVEGVGEPSELLDFLQREGRRRQFFPVLKAEELDGRQAPRLEDFFVFRESGEICGALAIWDQAAYKQTVVESYSRGLRWSRTLLNGFLGGATLPPEGCALEMAYASLVCVPVQREHIFRNLLQAALAEANRRGKRYLMLGLHERDPHLKVAQRFRHIPYGSRLCTVDFEERRELDDRLPYVEVATL